jgi:hypothetical protein
MQQILLAYEELVQEAQYFVDYLAIPCNEAYPFSGPDAWSTGVKPGRNQGGPEEPRCRIQPSQHPTRWFTALSHDRGLQRLFDAPQSTFNGGTPLEISRMWNVESPSGARALPTTEKQRSHDPGHDPWKTLLANIYKLPVHPDAHTWPLHLRTSPYATKRRWRRRCVTPRIPFYNFRHTE